MTASLKKYAWIERRRIHRAAKKKLGQRMNGDGDSYQDFMEECVGAMMEDVATMSEDEAMEACQMVWDEEGDY